MFNPLDFAEFQGTVEVPGFEGTYDSYMVDDDAMYPAMLSHIKAVLESGDLPDELIDREQRHPEILPTQRAKMFVSEARALEQDAFQLAMIPRSEFEDGEADLTVRAQALELARRWFTAALRNVAGPIHVHHVSAAGKRFRQ